MHGTLTALVFMSLMGMALAQDNDDAFFHLAGTSVYRPPKDKVETQTSLPIGQGGDIKLQATIFRPKNATGVLPAILFIHGGGWRSGKHYNIFGAWLAERGYLVASIDYRLMHQGKWPAQIEDCKLGVRWLRANAAKFGIDPERIGVFGTSAGGHLSACVALLDDPELEGDGGYPETSSKVMAVAAFCPPTDLTGEWLPGTTCPAWVEDLFGAPYAEKPEAWKQASPALNVKPGAPPFFIAHGTNDTHAPTSQGEKLRKALEEKGVPVEYVAVKNGRHDFFVNPSTPQTVTEPTREDVMRKLLAFFDRNLKAPANAGGS